MSYSESFPTQRPIFTLDAANAGRLDSRISYTRSTTGSFYGKDKHLSSENLLLQSSDFDTTWWAENLNGRNSGQTDPAGGTDGFEIVESTANSWHRVYQTVTATGDITVVVYAKQNSGTRYLMLTVGGGGNNLYECATFDLAGGTPNILHGSSSSFTNVSATQTASGNGYYKCVLKATGTCSSLNISITNTTATPAGNPYGLQVYTGDNSSSLDIAFASLTTTGATDYNATTTQIHRAYAPTLQTAAINAPRFEHSATDSASEAIGQSRGLLIEGSSTNLVSFSESFSNQTVNDCTLTEGAAVGPDATLSANLLVPTTTANLLRNVNLDDGNSFSHTSGNNYAYSIFAKAAGYNYVQWVGLGYFGYTYCNFDLSSGTVGNKSGSVTGSVESVGNGWYRLTVVAPATVTNSSASKGVWAVVTSSTAARNEQFTGDGYSGVLLTMAQCELSSFASSYIKSNSGSATTRAADSASMVDANLFDNGSGAVLVETGPVSTTNYPTPLTISDQTSKNLVRLQGNSTGTNMEFQCKADNSLVVQVSTPFTASGTKLAASYNTNAFSFCADGGTVVSDSSGQLPEGLDKLHIGTDWNSSNTITGHIKRIAVYPALTDTNLQALTS